MMFRRDRILQNTDSVMAAIDVISEGDISDET